MRLFHFKFLELYHSFCVSINKVVKKEYLKSR